MSELVVLVTDKIAAAAMKKLEERFVVREIDGNDREVLLSALPEADAVIIRSSVNMDKEAINCASKLKIIGRSGVGLDNIDIPAATEAGILVANTLTANMYSAAEHAIALLLATARSIPAADASLRAGNWNRSKFMGVEIFGKTVGIIGFGRIGRLVAERLKAFGTNILVYDPYVTLNDPNMGVAAVDLDSLLAKSDFITLHVPKTKETVNILDKEKIDKIKPGAIIINAARGGIVDELALSKAIKHGKIAGAGFDVFYTEPCIDSVLYNTDKTAVTPHLGGTTVEAQDRASFEIVESVELALSGKPVPAAVNEV